MRRLLCTVLLLAAGSFAGGQPAAKPLEGELPPDGRFGKPRTLHDKDFFFQVPLSREAWERRRQQVREQVLVGNGLWPLPEKTPLNAVIHGKIDRDGYTVEKVFFASMPGHYVTGNLYRPTAKSPTGKFAGVLCPHGHWPNGRFYDAGEAGAKKQIEQGAEKHMSGARYPLQARCAQLARMGCVVFHYDMVGYADSKQLAHRAGFTDVEAELRLQNVMGLQTWNSIRALDFLLGLPEVDSKRIGVTGASGGGTQTFILCGIDDRPTAAFPAVMVSTQMQGGCVCENCSYLRQGTGNIELAGLFAPKPLAMSGANDWTIAIEKKGLPELKALYRLYGVEDRVDARCWPQFGHNYNQVAREYMYNWFNKHLQLGHKEPVVEQPFVPVPPAELSVFDDKHPVPKDAVDAERLRKLMTEASDKQITALLPSDARSLAEYRRVIGTALRVLVNDQLPKPEEVEADGTSGRLVLRRKGQREAVPAELLRGTEFNGTIVVWIHPKGRASLRRDGKLVPAAQQILDRKAALLAPDVFWTGELRGTIVQLKLDPAKLKSHKLAAKDVQLALEKAEPRAQALDGSHYLLPRRDGAEAVQALGDLVLRPGDGQPVRIRDVGDLVLRDTPPVNEGYAGYTFGYNRPLLANRVHDILTAVAYAHGQDKVKAVHLVGFEKAGPWVVLARGLCGDAVARTAVDLNQFRFESVRSLQDEMMLPGALKYGGLPAFGALCAPGELLAHNHRGTGSGAVLKAAYKSSGKAEHLQGPAERMAPEKVVEWLLR